MQISNLETMVKGWFVGNFEPSVIQSDAFEVAVKRYRAGDFEEEHVHKIATELTVVVDGVVEMNGQIFGKNQIIKLEPGEPALFKVIEDATTVVVKLPSVMGDKYILSRE